MSAPPSSVAGLLAAGLLATPDHVLNVTPSLTGQDRGRPQRALDVRALGGLEVRLLPDRGLDIAGAWYRGLPLHWTSRVGEAPPLDDPGPGTRWITAFGGGLLTTCGLRNVGAPSEGHGLHGTYAHLPARDVGVERDLGAGARVVVRGTVDDLDALGHHLRCERTVTVHAGTPLLEVEDTVTNLGPAPEPAPMLYHVNVGAPLWAPGARLAVEADEVVPRDADAEAALTTWSEAPEPVPGAPERVLEHVGARPRAVVTNQALGLALEVSWDAATMPRLHQWVHPAAGVYVLGVEPANCSVLGRAHDRAEGRLPVLAPGGTRTTSVRVSVTTSP